MIIYKITNKVNGKIYVGQTIRPLEVRWNYHQWQNSCTALHRAIKKYGSSNFTIEQIDCADNQEKLNQKEQFWISYYNSMVPNGYNLQSGGNRFEVTSETRKRLSESLTGRKLSEETKVKIGNASKARVNGRFGKPVSEIQKVKCRISNPNRKEVLCVETGIIYLSMTQAAKENGTHRSHIADVINGKRIHAGGFRWVVIE